MKEWKSKIKSKNEENWMKVKDCAIFVNILLNNELALVMLMSSL